MEEWKEVVGYEGLYLVSSTGRIASIKACSKPQKANPYFHTTLTKDGKETGFQIHRLVVEAFIGPRPDGTQIDHIDRNKLNNHKDNLRYIPGRMNLWNRDCHTKNKVGISGIHQSPRNTWRARINREGRTVFCKESKDLQVVIDALEVFYLENPKWRPDFK